MTRKPLRRTKINFTGSSATGRGAIEHQPGDVLANCTIIRKAAAATRTVRWWVRMSECGHEQIVDGVQLRQAHKNGKRMTCFVCSPRKEEW